MKTAVVIVKCMNPTSLRESISEYIREQFAAAGQPKPVVLVVSESFDVQVKEVGPDVLYQYNYDQYPQVGYASNSSRTAVNG